MVPSMVRRHACRDDQSGPCFLLPDWRSSWHTCMCIDFYSTLETVIHAGGVEKNGKPLARLEQGPLVIGGTGAVNDVSMARELQYDTQRNDKV